jgi:hypothetical protein
MGRQMISIDECCYLLTTNLVSGFYFPESYLSIPELDHLIQLHNWSVFASEVAGWVYLRRRIVYQD